MKYEKLIKDFAERTMNNLVAIEKIAKAEEQEGKGHTTFEVTQLVNSCLGVFIIPWAEHEDMKWIPKTSLKELEDDGWPIPSLINKSELRSDLNLRVLVEYIRNAVAHYNLKFTSDNNDQINGLRMWNDNNDGTKRWESKLSKEDLRLLVKKFSQEIVQNLSE